MVVPSVAGGAPLAPSGPSKSTPSTSSGRSATNGGSTTSGGSPPTASGTNTGNTILPVTKPQPTIIISPVTGGPNGSTADLGLSTTNPNLSYHYDNNGKVYQYDSSTHQASYYFSGQDANGATWTWNQGTQKKQYSSNPSQSSIVGSLVSTGSNPNSYDVHFSQTVANESGSIMYAPYVGSNTPSVIGTIGSINYRGPEGQLLTASTSSVVRDQGFFNESDLINERYYPSYEETMNEYPDLRRREVPRNTGADIYGVALTGLNVYSQYKGLQMLTQGWADQPHNLAHNAVGANADLGFSQLMANARGNSRLLDYYQRMAQRGIPLTVPQLMEEARLNNINGVNWSQMVRESQLPRDQFVQHLRQSLTPELAEELIAEMPSWWQRAGMSAYKMGKSALQGVAAILPYVPLVLAARDVVQEWDRNVPDWLKFNRSIDGSVDPIPQLQDQVNEWRQSWESWWDGL